MKLKLRIGRRNLLAFALIVRQLWKHFRLPEHHLPWYDSARRSWTIFLPGTLWGCIQSLGMPDCEEMNRWQAHKCGSVQWFVGPEPFLGVSRQNIEERIKRWLENQHLVWWHGPCSTKRQARELISGPDLATRAWLLSFNRTQSRVVIGLLTGHNTLRRHLYIMGLSNNPTCRKCGIEEETSVHILCECETLASLRYTHLGSFFFGPWGY